MDLRIERIRIESPHRTGDQPQAGPVVDGSLVLGEHDQGRSRPVEARVHPARNLHPAGQRETNVDLVAHAVRGQGPADLDDDLVVRRDVVEGEREGRGAQAGQVFAQLEDAPVVQPESLPDRVAPLHHGVEGADSSLVAVKEVSVHIHEKVPVALVEALKHRSSHSLMTC